MRPFSGHVMGSPASGSASVLGGVVSFRKQPEVGQDSCWSIEYQQERDLLLSEDVRLGAPEGCSGFSLGTL